MNLKEYFNKLKYGDGTPVFQTFDIFKFIGPGLLVTVGFIDPGNWAANLATGSGYGYSLLWVVTISTIMLIILQHNVAHLGIATGLCLSEASTIYVKPAASRFILYFAMLASVSTSLAEILGGAIALQMLFSMPIKIGAVLVTVFSGAMVLSQSYKKIEKWIIGFVSLIGLSFLYELSLVDIPWAEAGAGWVIPKIPGGSIGIIMSVLGAVVMPHNLFLHSEVIQSRQWNMKDEQVIKRQLKYEFADTLFSMLVGWAINSAIIILAAAAFFQSGAKVDELQQAEKLLQPLLGGNASLIFASALLFSGVASSITSAMAGGTIFAGIYREPYNIKDVHTRTGIGISLVAAMIIIFFISDPFNGLIISQIFLSIQLPYTIFLQIYLTSSKKVMGKYVNTLFTKSVLVIVAAVVVYLNLKLLLSYM